MKRPALWIGFPFLLGLVLASCTRLWIPVCGGVTVVAGAVLMWRRNCWKYVLLGTLSCLTACCVYWHTENVTYLCQLPFAGTETDFTGQVTELTHYSGGYATCVLNGSFPDGTRAKVEVFCDTECDYGDTVTLSGTPELLTSDYLYDAKRSGMGEGIFLRFDYPVIRQIIPLDRPTVRSVLYHWRMNMTERILASMNAENGALLIGLLFGDKSAMSRSSKTALYRMGIGHVLAVSGLHLDFLAVCLGWLLERMRAGRKLTFVLTVIFCGTFVLCAGETISVKRAFIMILLRVGAGLVFRTADPFNSLGIAVLLLGLENPFVVHSAAFWLSCTATWGVGVFAPYMTKEMRKESSLQKLMRSFMVSFWTFTAILPASAVYFREVSLISPLSNIFLVPVCMVSMLCGMAAILLGAASQPALLFLYLSDRLNGLILGISEYMSGMAWTHAPTSGSLLVPLLAAGILLALACCLISRDKKLVTRALLAALTIIVLDVGGEQTLLADALRIGVLGDGKDCVLALTCGNEALIVDMTGDRNSPAYADAFLTESGVVEVSALYLYQSPEQSAESYREYLICPEEIGVISEDAERQTLFHGARLTMGADTVRIEYAGQTCVCAKEGHVPEGTPEILILYGKNKTTLPDGGIYILLDENSPYQADAHTYVGENNLELTIADDGTCRVRRLYGST